MSHPVAPGSTLHVRTTLGIFSRTLNVTDLTQNPFMIPAITVCVENCTGEVYPNTTASDEVSLSTECVIVCGIDDGTVATLLGA